MIHQYLGLGVALILIVVGLTGSALVFEQEIDHFLLNLQVEKSVCIHWSIPYLFSDHRIFNRLVSSST